MKELSREELKQLLTRGWMTHDAMWFHNCVKELGVGQANALNRAAIRSLAGIEVKRLTRALGLAELRTYSQVRDFLSASMDLLVGDYMSFSWVWHPDPRVTVDLHRCFAYEGVCKLGVIEQYECGIYERICGWLNALGIGHDVTPGTKSCIMHSEGKCIKELRFHLQG